MLKLTIFIITLNIHDINDHQAIHIVDGQPATNNIDAQLTTHIIDGHPATHNIDIRPTTHIIDRQSATHIIGSQPSTRIIDVQPATCTHNIDGQTAILTIPMANQLLSTSIVSQLLTICCSPFNGQAAAKIAMVYINLNPTILYMSHSVN